MAISKVRRKKMSRLAWRSAIFLFICAVAFGLVNPVFAGEKAVKIGAILPLTGTSSLVGAEMKNGAMIAADEINSLGGVMGRELEIIFEDSESRPAAGVDAVHKLIDVDKVPVVIGSYSSSVTIPIQEYAMAYSQPLIW